MSHDKKILNDKLINLTKAFFQKEKVDLEFIHDVFEGLVYETSISYGKVNMQFSFSGLEAREGVTLSNVGNGKVFEVTGTNQRFKTTSLIIIGLILNYNFIDAESMLASNQLVSKVGELTKQLFTSNKFTVNFTLSSNTNYFKFEKKEEEIIVEISNRIEKLSLNADKFNEVFQQYAELADNLNLADVQFVSKGRNFVGQVHREITSEFISTLDSIKSNVEGTVKRFMEKVNYKDKLKEEPQIINEIAFAEKALSLISEITVPFSIIDHVFKLSEIIPAVIEHISLNELIQIEQEYIQRINKVHELNFNIQKEKDLFEVKLLVYLEKLNEYSNLPYRFINDNLEFRLKNFMVEYEDIAGDKDGLQISPLNTINGHKLASHVITGRFFSIPQAINNISDYNHFQDKLNEIHKKLFSLKTYIENNETDIIATTDKIKELKNLIRLNSDNKELYQSELHNVKSLIELSNRLEGINLDQSVRTFLAEVIKSKDFTNYKNIFRYIGKTDFNYSGEPEEELLENLELYRNELKESLMSESGNFLLPKKLRDISIMTKFLQDIRAVVEYLKLESLIDDNSSLMIAQASLKTNLHNETIKLFNDYMYERCRYYFEVLDANKIIIHPLLSYDFERKEFFIKDKKVSTSEGISGGTDSAMTVRSFASKKNNTEFGLVLLVDEWGDVGAELASKVYDTLVEIDTFGCGVFVKVDHQQNNVKIEPMR